MAYTDLIPNVFPLSLPTIADGETYHSPKFNIGDKACIGVTLKASQTLSIHIAYGLMEDTASAAGIDATPSLPYKTSATSFASNDDATEGGTYHELALPPSARQAQLVFTNSSGSSVADAVCDAAMRVVAYPAVASGGGGGSTDFADITAWPGSASQVVRANGSYSVLATGDIPSGLDATKLADGSVSNAEFQYIGTLTSNAQDQLDAKIPKSIVDAKGDLLAGTASDTVGRLAVGTNGHVLTADSAESTGIKWAAPSATDSTKLPLAGYSSGSAAMTGALAFTGTQSSPGSSISSLYRDASGNLVFNGGSGGNVQFGAGNYITTTASDRGIGFIQDCSVISAAMGVARYAVGLILQTTTIGNIVQRAKLQTRANSTTYSLGSLVAGDVARIVLIDSQDKQAIAKVAASGVVTFTSDSHADYVASGSPASGEVGVFVSGSGASQVINIRPGSAATRGIAAFGMIGVA